MACIGSRRLTNTRLLFLRHGILKNSWICWKLTEGSSTLIFACGGQATCIRLGQGENRWPHHQRHWGMRGHSGAGFRQEPSCEVGAPAAMLPSGCQNTDYRVV